MRTIETQQRFPLSSVKPLEGLLDYRQRCLEAAHNALQVGRRRRDRCPVNGERLEPCGYVDGFAYGRCSESGSMFLMDLPDARTWSELLAAGSRLRHSPEAFHTGLSQSRTDHVYGPKLEWIEDTLRLQQVHRPTVLEIVTQPSSFTGLLHETGSVGNVWTADETAIARGTAAIPAPGAAQVAVLLESLDRSDDPVELLRGVAAHLDKEGLVFVTALVASGFDMTILGLQNLYLYPPDRTNCFSLREIEVLLTQEGFTLLELSTPGVLDVEIVQAHLQREPSLSVSDFERQLIEGSKETQAAFQSFLQQRGLSSFARIVARKQR